MTSNVRRPLPAIKGVFTEGVIGLDGKPYINPNRTPAEVECGIYESHEEIAEETPRLENARNKNATDDITLSNPIYDRELAILNFEKTSANETVPHSDEAIYEFPEDINPLEQMPSSNIGSSFNPPEIPNYMSMGSPSNTRKETGNSSFDDEPIVDTEEDEEHIYEDVPFFLNQNECNESSRTSETSFPLNEDGYLCFINQNADSRPEKIIFPIRELVDTEEKYLSDLELIINDIKKPLMEEEYSIHIKLDKLFSNIEEIRDFTKSFLASLKLAEKNTQKDELPNVGKVFLENLEQMKDVYMVYCRNHDDTISYLQHLQNDQEFQNCLGVCVNNIKKKSNVIDFGSLLIKPVQRVLKYHLLLKAILEKAKLLPNRKDSIWYDDLDTAYKKSELVAKEINEGKRLKDIVSRYRRNSKNPKKSINLLHSVHKKANRLSMKLAHATGRNVLNDENYNRVEIKFSQVETQLKGFVENCKTFLSSNGEIIENEDSLADEIENFYGSGCTRSVNSYKGALVKTKNYLFKKFHKQVGARVIAPVQVLIKQMDSPKMLMKKRNDKLLDYEKCLEQSDEKTQEAEEIYNAMNGQLLDELPKFFDLAHRLLESCLKLFIQLQINFYVEVKNVVMPVLKELPGYEESDQLIQSRSEIAQRLNLTLNQAKCEINCFTIIPNMVEDNINNRTASIYGNSTYYWSFRKRKESQTTSSKQKLLSDYKREDLYLMIKDYSSTDKTDMSSFRNDLIAVIKRKDPLGNSTKWFCDNGVSQGFLPVDLLTPYEPVPNSIYETIAASKTYSHLPYTSRRNSSISSTSSLSPYLFRESKYDTLPNIQENHYITLTDSAFENEVFDVEDEMLDDREYGTFEGVYFQNNKAKNLYVVQHQFASRGHLELSVNANDVVTVIMNHDKEGNNDWWFVANSDGKQGYVPANYLRQYLISNS